MRVILSKPRGFCAGVTRAIDIVELALKKYGPPVYVRHEIVHNKRVVEDLKAKGAVFVEELDEVPDGAHTVFSAHGVSKKVADEAGTRDLPVIDATCPLVAKVHKEGQRYSAKDYDIILIGHEGHPEVIGTMGRIPGKVYLVSTAEDVGKLEVRDPNKLAYVTQTTLSVDDTRDVIEALKARFPTVVGPDVKDICYATQNRQSAVRELAGQVDLLLVVGAQNSSNSKRLSEIGKELNVPSYLIDDASGLNEVWLENIKTIGITAGASAPEKLVQDLIKRLGELVDIEVEEVDGINENVQFRLPKELREAAA
ncbi:MAG: 4-hydroxy-3-methylbut-2-enyl diphosphate reductase [Pseudomonadota bacterium]|nr:4-hydroxy-3-methylbut-2-enyl diphosphate reductase [Pseudomonadota bacterium]